MLDYEVHTGITGDALQSVLNRYSQSEWALESLTFTGETQYTVVFRRRLSHE